MNTISLLISLNTLKISFKFLKDSLFCTNIDSDISQFLTLYFILQCIMHISEFPLFWDLFHFGGSPGGRTWNESLRVRNLFAMESQETLTGGGVGTWDGEGNESPVPTVSCLVTLGIQALPLAYPSWGLRRWVRLIHQFSSPHFLKGSCWGHHLSGWHLYEGQAKKMPSGARLQVFTVSSFLQRRHRKAHWASSEPHLLILKCSLI